MNIRGRKREGAELSVESLNDIMFFLLLFFLIVSTLANPNVIKLMLPSSKQSEQTSKKPISISVTKDLRYYVEKKEVPFEELEPTLKSFIEKAPDGLTFGSGTDGAGYGERAANWGKPQSENGPRH